MINSNWLFRWYASKAKYPNTPQEIQFEEHKLLIVYGSPLEPYEFTLESHGVAEKQGIQFITEAEHVHSTSERFADQFEELKSRLGMDGYR